MRSITARRGVTLGAILGALAFVAGTAAPVVPQTAPAPSAVSISELHIDIWPEHDDPRVLVIYRGTLNAAVSLPYALAFTIPPTGQVNAAAYRSATGQLLSAQYQYRQQGDRLQVTFTVPERGFQFEYYADLSTAAPQRTMSVDLAFPLPVDALRVSVEQPARATTFSLAPQATSTSTTSSGLTLHHFALKRVPAQRSVTVRATYRKPDATPSFPRSVAPPPAPSGPSPNALPVWFWAAAAAVLGAATLGAYLYLVRSGRARRPGGRATTRQERPMARQEPPRAGSPAPDRKPPRAPEPGGEVPRAYCPNCGARVRPRDRFCSRCGEALS